MTPNLNRPRIGITSTTESALPKTCARSRARTASGSVLRSPSLAKIPPAANLDLDKIRRQEPWLRLRVGNFRVLFRQLTRGEMDVLCLRRGTLAGATGFLIGRVVDKQDVERAIDTLDLIGLDSPD
jgi:hypothetical protein